MFRVARNEANRFLRQKHGRREGEAMILAGAVNGFTAAFVAPDEPSLALLLRAAEGLPPEQKEAVFLKVFDGLTFKEIASVCGVSANTAASRYRYGIEKLREAVGGEIVKDDRSEATGFGAPDIERELGKLARSPSRRGCVSGSWIGLVISGVMPCFRRG